LIHAMATQQTATPAHPTDKLTLLVDLLR
jgi:hypothetical protein